MKTDNVAAGSRWLRLTRTRLIVIGAALAVMLIGVSAFVVVTLPHSHRTPPQPATQVPPAPAVYAIPGCYNPSVPPLERPKRLNIVGCASVAVALQDMSWTSWGPQGADATGSAVFKICDPNCATGYQIADPVVVHAWNPQPPRPDAVCQAGLKIFADMILAFPKDVPPPSAQRMNTEYNGAPAVHYVNYRGADPHGAEFIGYTFCN